MNSSRFPPFDNSLSEDEKVVKSFVDVIQEKLDANILKIPKVNGKERKILQDAIFYPGAIVGSVVTVAAFIGMRRGPVYIMNNVLKKHHEKMNKTTKPPTFQEGPAALIIGSLFDAAFASLLGVTAWTISTNKQKALMAAADIPLIEGHSAISDTLCNDFISIYKDIRPQFWKEHSDDTLTAIQTFVKNCEKRQLYQKRLRREMGLDEHGKEDDDVHVQWELPSRVPEDIIQQEKDRFDGAAWAALEDFEEPLDHDDEDDTSFWDDK